MWLQDEVKALGRLNIGYFLVGFLGFLTTWILDMIYMFLRKEAVKHPNQIIKALFSAFAPHYLLSRCLYDISQTYLEASGRPNADPFTYAVTGRAFLLLALQAAGTVACKEQAVNNTALCTNVNRKQACMFMHSMPESDGFKNEMSCSCSMCHVS